MTLRLKKKLCNFLLQSYKLRTDREPILYTNTFAPALNNYLLQLWPCVTKIGKRVGACTRSTAAAPNSRSTETIRFKDTSASGMHCLPSQGSLCATSLLRNLKGKTEFRTHRRKLLNIVYWLILLINLISDIYYANLVLVTVKYFDWEFRSHESVALHASASSNNQTSTCADNSVLYSYLPQLDSNTDSRFSATSILVILTAIILPANTEFWSCGVGTAHSWEIYESALSSSWNTQ